MKNEETSNIQPANTEQRYGAHVLNLSAFPGLRALTDIARKISSENQSP